jgi:hypothetical protein
MRNKKKITSTRTTNVLVTILVTAFFIFSLSLSCLSQSNTKLDSLSAYTSFELMPFFNSASTIKTKGVVTEYSTPLNLGGLAGVKLGYSFKSHWLIEMGIESGIQHYSLSFNLPPEKYNLPRRFKSTHRFVGLYLSVPLEVCYKRKFNEDFFLVGSFAFDYHSLLNITSGSTSYSIIDKNTGNDYEILEISGSLKADYNNGFSIGMGIGRVLAPGTFLRLDICYRFSPEKIFSSDYNFFPEQEQFKTTGKWYGYGNIIGVSISYVMF